MILMTKHHEKGMLMLNLVSFFLKFYDDDLEGSARVLDVTCSWCSV